VAQDKADRLLGGDISMLPVYEQRGTVYRAADGTPVSLLPWLRQQGWNAMRVRLFVDPDKSPQKHKEEGVCQDIDFVVRLGRQIQQAGYQFMLDFHYSDYWADPGKQTMPQRWENIRRDNLPDSVYQYTLHTLQSMKRQGVVPELIQVGNETTNGMLWPLGKAMPLPRKAKDAAEPTAEAVAQWTEEWDYLCRLYHAGCRACREVCPDARIIIHTEKAGSWEATQSYYQQLCHHEVDYDIIGLSYYPMWHGTIANLGQNLDRLSAQFPEKDVMIVEAAAYYSHENDPWATADKYSEFYPISVEGQLAFARELVGELRRHSNVKGLFWWFPEENASGSEVTKGWLNRGLFDNHTGRALPALQAFSQFTDNKE
jgi:arabinogalactan endo-1,4-beta-galactosidase